MISRTGTVVMVKSDSIDNSPIHDEELETPLDMTISKKNKDSQQDNKHYQGLERPSVITKAPSTPVPKDPCPNSPSVCDSVIDEHFRKSLGNKYLSMNDEQSVVTAAPTVSNVSSPTAPTNAVELSVNEHFAKALGDTWKKLQMNLDS